MQISKTCAIGSVVGVILWSGAAFGAGVCTIKRCDDTACVGVCGGNNGTCVGIVQGTSQIFSMCACTSCGSGWSLTAGNSVPGWAAQAGALAGAGCTTMDNDVGELANGIQKCTSPCDNCEVETTFTAIGTSGYRRRVKSATCSTTTKVCTKTYEYRCATDWFGSSTNGVSGCTKCPTTNLNLVNHCGGDAETTSLICSANSYKQITGDKSECIECPKLDGVPGITDNGTAITDCYIQTGRSFSDETGTWQFTDKCYYTE